MEADRERWDERHRGAPEDEPGPPLGWIEAGGTLPRRGRALDVACGRGGVAVWVALAGLDVVALDVSPVAVAATVALARAHGVDRRVDARVHDLDGGLPARTGRFDLVVCQRYRDPSLILALLGALRPEGTLALSVLSEVGAERPGRHHAAPGELVTAVRAAGGEVVWAREADGTAAVVARRRSGEHGI